MNRTGPQVKEALLYEKMGSEVKCLTCERRCRIRMGERGFCQARENIDGKLYTLVYGEVAPGVDGIQANPIEKKPLFHFWPGTRCLTVGTWSCNFACPWCQNHHMSKRPDKIGSGYFLSPQEFVRLAGETSCQGTSISFNEPTLLFEYSLDAFELAGKQGLYNTYVTNGYMTEDALEILIDHGLDAMNINIKGDREGVGKYCQADVETVWRNAGTAKRNNVWIELTTLVIPGVNDDEECLKAIAIRIGALTVLETYPGAAQDILRIPRKGKGLDKLANGLRQAGIKGLNSAMNGDELDAITCALF